MARKGVNLYDIDNLPDNLRDALLDLRLDFDAHTHDGSNSSSITTLTVETMNARVFSIRKTNYTSTIAGLWMGLAGDYVYFNVGDADRYFKYNGQTGAVSIQGDITAGSININSGNASIDSDGSAVFKDIKVGGATTQYIITNDGNFQFGDGSDGTLTTSGNVTLTEDKYYTNLTVSSGDIFSPAGYRIFVSGTLTVIGTIRRNGNNGSNGGNGSSTTGGSGGTGGVAVADGYLKGSVAGGTGGDGGDGYPNTSTWHGDNGTSNAVSNSIGKNGVAGGAGGSGGSGDAGGNPNEGTSAGATATASNVKLVDPWHIKTLLDVTSTGALLKMTASASGGGGGGGSGGTGDASPSTDGGGAGGGGAAGSGGGIIAIYAREIIIQSGGVIEANGGNGGNGGNGADGGGSGGTGGGGGGGGAGAGGNGGELVFVYNSLTNSGSITVTGGAAGAVGTGGSGTNGGGDGDDGNTGTAGTAGTIRQFAVSI